MAKDESVYAQMIKIWVDDERELIRYSENRDAGIEPLK